MGSSPSLSSFEKEVVLVGIALFVMHLPCTLDSCKIPFNLELGVFGGLPRSAPTC